MTNWRLPITDNLARLTMRNGGPDIMNVNPDKIKRFICVITQTNPCNFTCDYCFLQHCLPARDNVLDFKVDARTFRRAFSRCDIWRKDSWTRPSRPAFPGISGESSGIWKTWETADRPLSSVNG